VESDYFLFASACLDCASLLVQRRMQEGHGRRQSLLEFGTRNSHIRSMVCGHWSMGHSHFIRGDFPAAIECYNQAVEISVDPYYSQIPEHARIYLCSNVSSTGRRSSERGSTLQREVRRRNHWNRSPRTPRDGLDRHRPLSRGSNGWRMCENFL